MALVGIVLAAVQAFASNGDQKRECDSAAISTGFSVAADPVVRGGNMHKLVVVSAIATTLLGSCTTSPDAYYASQTRCDVIQPDPAVAQRCFAVPQARDYLEQTQKRVLDAWQLPRGISANQNVSLTFRLRLDGSIQCLSLSSDPKEALARSVVSAVQRVTPFTRLPSQAVCLAELPVVANFSNPLEKQ